MRDVYKIAGNFDALSVLGLVKSADAAALPANTLAALEQLSRGQSSGKAGLTQLFELIQQHPLIAMTLATSALLALRALRSKDTEQHPFILQRKPGT